MTPPNTGGVDYCQPVECKILAIEYRTTADSGGSITSCAESIHQDTLLRVMRHEVGRSSSSS